MVKKNQPKPPSPAVTHFPSPIISSKTSLSKEEKISLISDRFKDIMEILGLDLTNDSLAKTPGRIARMYVEEVFSGLDSTNFPSISFFEHEPINEYKSNSVFLKVGFTSFCEHHFVPMTGFAYVAYIPQKKLIGLSKVPRIVRYFARRPQLQERLNAQIADSLALILQIEDVAVSLSAKHYCVRARGIQDENGHTITTILRGRFSIEDPLRREFFENINRLHPT